MKPETRGFLDKANRRLQRAQKMIELDLPEDAARTAYIACFHLAQAIVFERTGRIAKTHSGVHALFYQEVNKPDDRDIRDFLSQAYDFKQTSDYVTSEEQETTFDDASQAVETASRFFAHFTKLLE